MSVVRYAPSAFHRARPSRPSDATGSAEDPVARRITEMLRRFKCFDPAAMAGASAPPPFSGRSGGGGGGGGRGASGGGSRPTRGFAPEGGRSAGATRGGQQHRQHSPATVAAGAGAGGGGGSQRGRGGGGGSWQRPGDRVRETPFQTPDAATRLVIGALNKLSASNHGKITTQLIDVVEKTPAVGPTVFAAVLRKAYSQDCFLPLYAGLLEQLLRMADADVAEVMRGLMIDFAAGVMEMDVLRDLPPPDPLAPPGSAAEVYDTFCARNLARRILLGKLRTLLTLARRGMIAVRRAQAFEAVVAALQLRHRQQEVQLLALRLVDAEATHEDEHTDMLLDYMLEIVNCAGGPGGPDMAPLRLLFTQMEPGCSKKCHFKMLDILERLSVMSVMSVGAPRPHAAGAGPAPNPGPRGHAKGPRPGTVPRDASRAAETAEAHRAAQESGLTRGGRAPPPGGGAAWRAPRGERSYHAR
jgi:hypothetical protein